MSTPTRDEHFKQFAKQQFDDVDDMFSRLFLARQDCDQARETEAINDIQLYMARRAYDLVEHATKLIHYEIGHYPLERLVLEVPDLTELPKEQ